MKATQVCIERRMDEENVVHPYNGILFSLKGNSDACYSMNEPWNEHYAKRKKLVTKDTLYDSKIGKSIKTESRLVD